MTKITLDTGVLPADDLIELAQGRGFEFAAISVSERELEGTSFAVGLKPLTRELETAVWGESSWDGSVWGGGSEALGSKALPSLEDLLAIVSNGSFPPTDRRVPLTNGEQNQLRDAMILEAHVRANRDVFVTTDVKAFVSAGRRERLASLTGTRIMTRAEFADLLRGGGAV